MPFGFFKTPPSQSCPAGQGWDNSTSSCVTAYRYWRLRPYSGTVPACSTTKRDIYTIVFRWNDVWRDTSLLTSATAGNIGGLTIGSVTSASADTGNEAWRMWASPITGWRSGTGSYNVGAPNAESTTQWVVIDFGASNTVWITGYTLYADASCTIDAYYLEYSSNNSSWTKINASEVTNADLFSAPVTTTW